MALRTVRAFKLQLERGVFVSFAKGQIVPDDYADHWYVIENSDTVREAPPAPATPVVAAPSAKIGPESDEPTPETDEELARDAELIAKGVTKDDLIKIADDLGIKIDRRWGLARLQAEIEKATTK